MWGYRWAMERNVEVNGRLEPDPPKWIEDYGKAASKRHGQGVLRAASAGQGRPQDECVPHQSYDPDEIRRKRKPTRSSPRAKSQKAPGSGVEFERPLGALAVGKIPVPVMYPKALSAEDM
jgi:hypothetical protein